MYTDREDILVQQGYQRLASASLKETTSQGVRLLTQAGVLDVTFYGSDAIRLRLARVEAPDYGLLVGAAEPVAVQTTPLPGGVRVAAGDLALDVTFAPLRITLRRGDRALLESANDRSVELAERFYPFGFAADAWQVSLALRTGEAVFGLGEKYGPLNHRGELVTSWNADALGVNSERSYKNVPFAWSPEGWGVFAQTPAKVTHAVGYGIWSNRSYVLRVHEPNLDLFLLAGETPADLLRSFTRLTGRTPLPPVWSYGMWMARAYYRTADELLDAARTLRNRQIPCDVMLLDGRAWHVMQTRFDFSWDPDRYPDPAAFVQQVRDLDLRLCLWEYPYISVYNPLFNELAEKGYLLRTADGEPYVYRWFPTPFDTLLPQLMPSGIIDFTNPDAYAWFRDQHKPLFEMGVAVMKTDFGEAVPEDAVAYNGDTGARLHNVYSLLYNQCAFEAAAMYSSGQPMVWGRSGWTGSQRVPLQWGGDPQCDWGGLAGSVRGGLSLGLSGVPFYSHDIGGFYHGVPEPELYVRWAQAGMMTSHTRFHGTGPREPWVYGDEAERIVREWIEWRYRLIPYLMACARQAEQSGLPVTRAMPLVFPDHRPAWGFDLQYMFGPSLLVAPVVEPGGDVTLYLPPGVWYDIWSGERLEGPRYLELTVPLDRIPIYGREGTVLPLGPVVQHTGELPADRPAISEIWTFGIPGSDAALPGLDLPLESLPAQAGALIKHTL